MTETEIQKSIDGYLTKRIAIEQSAAKKETERRLLQQELDGLPTRKQLAAAAGDQTEFRKLIQNEQRLAEQIEFLEREAQDKWNSTPVPLTSFQERVRNAEAEVTRIDLELKRLRPALVKARHDNDFALRLLGTARSTPEGIANQEAYWRKEFAKEEPLSAAALDRLSPAPL